jgi:hypothetical protein
MRRFVLALALLTATAATSHAITDQRLEKMLLRIDPADRLEQICDFAAADRIGRAKNAYHPDRAVIDSISPVNIVGDTVHGTGGAFRSGGQWYRFSFACTTTPDHLRILSFDFRVGEKIPPEKWQAFGLWR